MELGFGVVVPLTGARADVAVRAPAHSRLGDVRAALLDRVLPPGGSDVLSVEGRPLSAGATLGRPPLLHGAMLRVGAPPHDLPPDVPVALYELRCTGGPDAGRSWPVQPGDLVVGRDPTADVRVDDADLSRRHCVLRVPQPPELPAVLDLGSTNGTAVDGAEVTGEGVALPVGALLRAGASSFALLPPSEPPVPVTAPGDGRLAWNRPPRLRSPHEVAQVVVPPPPGERERTPLPLLAVLAPVALGIVLWLAVGSATFLLLTLLSPVLLVGGVVTERRAGRRRGRRALALWTARREVAEASLAAAVRADEQARRDAWPDPATAAATATGPGARLWERRRTDDDLLDLRLGLADAPARVEAEGDLPAGAATARDVPVVVPLRAAGVLGVAGPRAQVLALARWLVVQAAVWHAPRDLQLVVLAPSTAAGGWAWVRWLPHTRPDTGQACRALVGFTRAQAAARVAELTLLVESRRAERAGGPADRSPVWRQVLLVLDGARALRTVPGLAVLLADGPSVGVHVVAVEGDARLLPEECRATAVLDAATGLRVGVAGRPTTPAARPDLVDVGYAERVARALAPLRDDSRERDGPDDLPVRVRWTDVVGLPLTGGGEDVARLVARWSGTGGTTRAVLGRVPDGVLAVDLRRDGPHALVAGTTGSGKSELLQTLVASLALGNRPDELTFVLVDYKGGAAFGPCARLPHVVGMVTDLDGGLVERALVSLGAELRRREAVLAAAGAKDVEELRRSPGAPALARLVLVVDEFAALAVDLPDFVAGLVGIAQRGRSLGVHLVLATQRPEGVVSADIRANTNLRLCLAVQRESESRDVVDSPAAARIGRTTPGRGYARTGHAELTPFQTARVGGRRPRPDRADDRPTVTLLPVEELGDPAVDARTEGEPSDDDPADDGTDLALFVHACAEAAVRLGVPLPAAPWLPPLPEQVLLAALPRPADPRAGTPGRVLALTYGLLDVPAEQAQRPLVLDLDTSRHLLVVGAPRSGRTTVLRTLAGAVAATASPDDVHLYVVDPGAGLGALAVLPHTGAVVGRGEPERLDRLLGWLGVEVARRQSLLAAGGHPGPAEQRAAAPPAERLPHLLLLLDSWEAFLADHADLDAGRLVDAVHRLLHEGPSVGLHLVVSGDRTALLGRLGALVDQRLVLRLADRGDYAAAGIPARAVPDDLPAGRGFWSGGAPLVAQVAVPSPDGPAAAAEPAPLTGSTAAVATWPTTSATGSRTRPHRVEPLPTSVRLDSLRAAARVAGRRAVVLGVGGDELEPVVLDLAEHPPGLVVAGPAGSGRSSALLVLAAGLAAVGVPVHAVAPRRSPLRALPGCLTGVESGDELAARLDAGPCALLVDDAELLVDSPLAPVLERAVRAARDGGTVVALAGTTEELVTGFRGFVVDVRRSRTGVLLSPRAADGDLLGVRLPRALDAHAAVPGRGVLVVGGRARPVQLAWTGVAARGPGSPGLERPFDDAGRTTVVDQDAVTQNPEKDPSDWVTGDEPATGPQQSYLTTLAQQAGEHVEVAGLTKSQASEQIERLKGSAPS